jgi:hypothetical protein
VSRPARNLHLFTEFVALAATPALMIAGFAMFGSFAAAQFRIYDMFADYRAGVVTALALLLLINFWPIPAAHRRILVLLWLVRIGVTLGVMLAFEARYVLDASGYYRNGLALNDPLALLEFGRGTENIQALVGLVANITESYSAQKVIFSYIGLIGVYIFYRAATLCLGQEKIAALYALGLLPSLVFWSSIMGKDPIVLLGIAIYCYGVAGLMARQKVSMLVYVAIGLFIASYIRSWLGIIFIAPLIVTYVMVGRSPAVMKAIFLLITIPGFLITLREFSGSFSLETTQDLVTTTDQIATAWAHGGSGQKIEGGFKSISSMIAFLPSGAFTALFRPLPFEIMNLFGIMAGLENAFILSLFAIGLTRSGIGWIRHPVLFWAVTTLVVWSAAYGFASYQNLGTAFRFRVQVAPVLLLLGLYLTYEYRPGYRSFRWLKFGPMSSSPDQPSAADPASRSP